MKSDIEKSNKLEYLNKLFKLFFPSINLKLFTIIFISFFTMFLGIGINLSLPMLIKQLIEQIKVDKHSFLILIFLSSYSLLWTISHINTSLRELLMVNLIEKCVFNIKYEFCRNILLLNKKEFANYNPSEFISKIGIVERAIPMLIWGGGFFVLPLFFETMLAAIVLWKYYSLTVAGALIATLIGFLILTYKMNRIIGKYREKANDEEVLTNNTFLEQIKNKPIIQYYWKISEALTNFNKVLSRRKNAFVKYFSYLEYMRIFQGIVAGIGLFIISFIVINKIQIEQYSVSDFIFIHGYVIQFLAPLTTFGIVLRNMQEALVDVLSIQNILELPTRDDINLENSFTPKIYDIEFLQASFKYDEETLFKNLNIKIPNNKVTVIKGFSGKGKSTIFEILLKQYKIQQGKVLIGGYDIDSISILDLTKYISIAPQELYLFNDTLYNNLIYGINENNLSNTKLHEILSVTCLTEVIKKLPSGLNTNIGEEGNKLSYGQKQRLNLARALIREAQIYLLDEPTSALDEEMAKKIEQNIVTYLKGKTVGIISHRSSLFKLADIVIELD